MRTVKAMSATRQSWQEPSRTNHLSRDGRVTLCGRIVTGDSREAGPGCKSCERIKDQAS